LSKKKADRLVGNNYLDDLTINASYYYRVASRINSHPEELSSFFEKDDSLEVFANIFGMLKPKVREIAVRIASRLIIKIAKQISDTGFRSGNLKVVKGFLEGSEIEFDQSLERYLEEPEKGFINNIVSLVRQREKRAFVIMLDHSYSMRGLKVILAAVTAASVAHHFKKDYALISFNNKITVLKALEENLGPEQILEKIFNVELRGDTDMRLALEEGLRQLKDYDNKMGLILTDGAWNQGGDPLKTATRFDKLNVIAFPPAKHEKVKLLAIKGKGEFTYVENDKGIAKAIIKCFN